MDLQDFRLTQFWATYSDVEPVARALLTEPDRAIKDGQRLSEFVARVGDWGCTGLWQRWPLPGARLRTWRERWACARRPPSPSSLVWSPGVTGPAALPTRSCTPGVSADTPGRCGGRTESSRITVMSSLGGLGSASSSPLRALPCCRPAPSTSKRRTSSSDSSPATGPPSVRGDSDHPQMALDLTAVPVPGAP